MAYQEEILSETIVVENTKPPFGNAKTGAINTSNGKQFRAPPNMLGMLYPGTTYQVTYAVNEFNGKTYNMVKTIKQVGDEGDAPAPTPAPRAMTNGQTAPRPAVNQVPTGNQYHPDTQLSIFTCGALNQAIASQQVNVMDPQSIAQATRNIMQVYKNTLGAPPGATSGAMAHKKADPLGSDDMDGDSIPF